MDSNKMISISFAVRLLIIFVLINNVISTTDFDELNTPFKQNSIENELPVFRQTFTGWKCQCWNATSDTVDYESECACFGKLLYKIPVKLYKYITRLTVIDAGLYTLRKDSLQLYRNTIKDVVLSNLPNFNIIEMGTFRNLKYLRSIYISYCPQLKHIDGIFEGFNSIYFRSLHILKSGLQKIPFLSPLYETGKIIQMVDLEGNYLTDIPANSIKVKAEQVILNFNNILTIQEYAFNGSEIGKLSLKGNKRLTSLMDNSFKGIVNIRELDLSSTEIDRIPVDGLSTLEILRIENAPSLKMIPSIYDFKHLKEAWLTYSFHCCAFKYPARHDPTKHRNYQTYLKHVQNGCKNNTKAIRKRDIYRNYTAFGSNQLQDFLSNGGEFWGVPISGSENQDTIVENGFRADQPHDIVRDESLGTFHQTTVVLSGNGTVFCGSLSSRFDVQCYPKPDQLNPCEDIMGFEWLRVCVWIVLVMAIFGNLAVLIVMFASFSDLSVPKFLICHLAVADLFMGIYLLLLASMDLHSKSVYFNYAYDWQIGPGCQVAGFLTILGSQLSVFTLSVLTLERWFAITHAIYLNRRIQLSMAARIMIFGWFYSILMAALPLFGISSYSATSICLPMETKQLTDKIYLLTLLIITGVAFLLILICYTQIYLSLNTGSRSSDACGTSIEMTVARKMALLVFTDFACWAPIAFFSFTALIGYPLIDVTRSKILLVFFYPLNSCANPYLYALLTAQYKRDLYSLLSRFGLCTKKAHQYKLTYSLPTTNNSNPIPISVRGSIPGSTTNEIIYLRKCSKPINEVFV